MVSLKLVKSSLTSEIFSVFSSFEKTIQMEKRGPLLKNKPSPIASLFKFIFFLVVSVLMLPFTFLGGRYLDTKRNTTYFERLLTEIPKGDFSLLTTFSLETSYVWGLLFITFLVGAYLVYLDGVALIAKKLENKSAFIKIILVFFFLLTYFIAYSILEPDYLLAIIKRLLN